ncbi:MAG TPA: gamma-glutamyltransferase [Tepidisphaeraceae bacterium]|nr:gamma-glutamyltransferase [Tepidisphaeraceae bacterium]
MADPGTADAGTADAGSVAGTGVAGQRVTGRAIDVRHGAVVSVSAAASEAGRDVLMRGGNAVDAAVATAFALAVTFPEAGNIGGGGFMLVRPADGKEAVMIDYRETAPAAAAADMFARARADAGGGPSQHLLVGVPGTVRGLALAHEKFGKRPWRELVEPAIALAESGFVLNQDSADSLNEALARPGAEADEMRRVLGKPMAGSAGGTGAGDKWAAGDRLVQPELAATLRQIAEGGPSAFYDGPVAQAIVETVRGGGGIITASDLRQYQAKVREPVRGTFRGYDIIAPPPPTSGGITLVQMLNTLEPLGLRERGRWSPETLHLVIEIMRRAYLDRARHLGDPDFVPIPPHLTTKQHATKVAAGIDPKRATRSDALAPDLLGAGRDNESPQTTHFSVYDASGMAVSNTYTIEQRYGGRVMVRGMGFLLNNEMGDFNPRPGRTDRLGRIGTPPNDAAPGKRMLSSMTPLIVARDGRVVMVTGSPGGRTIINTVLWVLLNRLEFEMSPRESIDAPRFSQTWMPDVVTAERALLADHARPVEALRQMGHTIVPSPTPQGDAHTLFIDPDGTIHAVADDRRDGSAAGY